MSTFDIKHLTLSDLSDETVCAINSLLERLDSSRRVTTASVADALASSVIVVAVYEGKVIGMGTISLVGQLARPYCQVNDVAVLVDHEGRGVMTLIMDELERVSRELFGAKRAQLNSSREDAQARYARRGYEHYDTTLMRKPL